MNILPRVTKKKKIDIKKFEPLAKKIKKYFKEEREYLKKKYNENSPSSGVLVGN